MGKFHHCYSSKERMSYVEGGMIGNVRKRLFAYSSCANWIVKWKQEMTIKKDRVACRDLKKKIGEKEKGNQICCNRKFGAFGKSLLSNFDQMINIKIDI